MLLFCYILIQRSPSAGDQYNSWKIATVRNGELKMMMSIDRKPTRSKHIIYTTTLHFNWMAGLHFDWLIDWLIQAGRGLFVDFGLHALSRRTTLLNHLLQRTRSTDDFSTCNLTGAFIWCRLLVWLKIVQMSAVRVVHCAFWILYVKFCIHTRQVNSKLTTTVLTTFVSWTEYKKTTIIIQTRGVPTYL